MPQLCLPSPVPQRELWSKQDKQLPLLPHARERRGSAGRGGAGVTRYSRTAGRTRHLSAAQAPAGVPAAAAAAAAATRTGDRCAGAGRGRGRSAGRAARADVSEGAGCQVIQDGTLCALHEGRTEGV